MHTRTLITRKYISALGFFVSFGIAFLCFETMVFAAAEYTPLVGIPGVSTSGATPLPVYLNQVYKLIIALGALFGVIKIAYAGVKYSMSGIITDKESAKKDIKGVLLGLALLLVPFIVLNEINPNLTNLDVLHSAPKITLSTPPASNVSPEATKNLERLREVTGNPDLKISRGMIQDKCTYSVDRIDDGQGSYDEVPTSGEASRCQTECSAKTNSVFTDHTTYATCLYLGSENGLSSNPANINLTCANGYVTEQTWHGPVCVPLE